MSNVAVPAAECDIGMTCPSGKTKQKKLHLWYLSKSKIKLEKMKKKMFLEVGDPLNPSFASME